METAVDYLLKKGWKISSDPRYYDNYPTPYGLRNFTQNGINYDSFCGGYHRAFDFYSNETNDVPSVTAGKVITSEDYGNFGGTVEIRDAKGNDWIYGHLVRGTLNFKVGDIVQQGDIVGQQGSSNYYNNPMSIHLHLQLRPKGTNLNDEIAEVCSGIPIEKYDITNLKQIIDNNSIKGDDIKLEIINKTVTGYNLPERSGSVLGIVIHNDYGSYSAKQYYNTLVNAPYSRLANGIAHYYIDRKTIWRALDTYRVGWHTANQVGNNSYIGYEVVESVNASDKDFLANEESVFKQAAEDLLFYKLPANRNTVRLHLEFVPTACPHRSMLLQTGFNTITQGRPSDANIIKLKDYFISRIKYYMNGGSLQEAFDKIYGKTTTSTKPATTQTTTLTVQRKPVSSVVKEVVNKVKSVWKTSNGLRYKKESATFTCGVTDGIVTRYSKPSLKSRKAGLLKKGQKVKYDMVYLNEGYIWIKWTANDGKNIYMPVRQIDDKGNEGKLWGTIK